MTDIDAIPDYIRMMLALKAQGVASGHHPVTGARLPAQREADAMEVVDRLMSDDPMPTVSGPKALVPLRLRNGVCRSLEDAADALLREAMKDNTHAEKSDILTPWKYADRTGREIFVSEGVVDPAMRRGSFIRAWNRESPHLNSRETAGRGVVNRFRTMHGQPSDA